MYISWGNYEGPHTRDIPFEKILPIILKGRPRQLVLEAATPGHQHDWRVFERIKLPDDKVLVPGVIDVTNNYVEHPEVVADRLERFANVVGRERVIASTEFGLRRVRRRPDGGPPSRLQEARESRQGRRDCDPSPVGKSVITKRNGSFSGGDRVLVGDLVPECTDREGRISPT